MTLDPDRALAAAVVSQLLAEPAVTALVGNRIHGQTPREPVYPYLAITRHEVRPLSGDASPPGEHILTLTAVSRFAGAEETRAIVAAARLALSVRPVVSGQAVGSFWVSYSDVFRGSDWRFHLGVLRLRVVLDPQ
jgi:hypothetical protein